MELPYIPAMAHSPREAVALQEKLRRRIRLEPYKGPLFRVAGADVSYNKNSPIMSAAFVVLDAASMKVIERASAALMVEFPYIPGLLSFRELPALLEAWKRLEKRPDVLIFDGHGIAHPRRLGIASHAGLILDMPSIGCAKSILTGKHANIAERAGAHTPLVDRRTREKIGDVLRTKENVQPVYISPGHRMDFASALKIIRCACASTVSPSRRDRRIFTSIRFDESG